MLELVLNGIEFQAKIWLNCNYIYLKNHIESPSYSKLPWCGNAKTTINGNAKIETKVLEMSGTLRMIWKSRFIVCMVGTI